MLVFLYFLSFFGFLTFVNSLFLYSSFYLSTK